MKTSLPSRAGWIGLALLLVGSNLATARAQSPYHFLRQVSQATGLQLDVPIEEEGSRNAPLPILVGGSRFELWTVESNPVRDYLLDVDFVDLNLPKSSIRIVTEDPCTTVVRTRADRPFRVEVTTNGLLGFLGLPIIDDLIVVYRHVQSYDSEEFLGLNIGGLSLNANQGILISTGLVTGDGIKVLQYPITAIPGADRSKVMGEERFSVLAVANLTSPGALLSKKVLQVWPVADGTIEGIDEGQTIRTAMPDLTLTANDLYPDSNTYAQIYRGEKRDGVAGKVLEGSAVTVQHRVPQHRQLRVTGWDDAVTESGRWTVELLTRTPFGIDRLDHVTFNAEKQIVIRASVSSGD